MDLPVRIRAEALHLIPCIRARLDIDAMFAPPPTAALSREEIQAKRAQLQAKRESAGASSIGSNLQRTDSQSPKADKKSRRPFSAGKHGVEEIREEDKERWKFKKTKSKSSITTLAGLKDGGSGSPGPASPELMSPPPVPVSGPITPATGSFRGSDAGSLASSIFKDEGNASGAEKALTPGERASLPRGPPPKRPSRPDELFLPPTASPAGSLRGMMSPESARSSSPATPPPSSAPPSIPGAYPVAAGPKPIPLASPSSPPPTLPPMSPPPPVPEKSPLRQQRGARPYSQPAKARDAAKPGPKRNVSDTAGMTSAMAEMRMKDPITVNEGEPSQFYPASTADIVPASTSSEAEHFEDDLTGSKDPRSESPAKEAQSSSANGTGSENAAAPSQTQPEARPIVGASKIEKPVIKRQSAVAKKTGNAAAIRAALIGLEAAQNDGREVSIATAQIASHDGGVTGVLYNTENPNVQVEIPSPTSFANRDLPPTPSSIIATPTELYQSSPRNSMRACTISSGSIKRSPLAQITEFDVKVNSAPTTDEVSPHRLTTIPEFRQLSENTPPGSGAATPVPITTQIHLRGGSVVTVTPPELTAWQRSVYIQGPIKLPKPVILPKKNSVASMDAFQDAIDQVYQIALFMPRRRSDDAFVDDICDFFDEFGFDDMGGGVDIVMTDDIDVDEADEMDIDENGERRGSERFSTPPPTIEISPVEKAIAMDVAESMSTPASTAETYIPPVENEETLRARGIARLSQNSNRRNSQFSSKRNSQYSSRRNSQYSAYRRDSANASRRGSSSGSSYNRNSAVLDSETGLPLLPPPEESMLDAVLEASHDIDEQPEELLPEGDAGGMDWDDDDDVQETDSSAPWTSPAKAMAYKKHALNRGLVGRERKNPVARMKRFVATATTIL